MSSSLRRRRGTSAAMGCVAPLVGVGQSASPGGALPMRRLPRGEPARVAAAAAAAAAEAAAAAGGGGGGSGCCGGGRRHRRGGADGGGRAHPCDGMRARAPRCAAAVGLRFLEAFAMGEQLLWAGSATVSPPSRRPSTCSPRTRSQAPCSRTPPGGPGPGDAAAPEHELVQPRPRGSREKVGVGNAAPLDDEQSSRPMALVALADNVARSMDTWLARSKANSSSQPRSTRARRHPSGRRQAQSVDLEKSEWEGDTLEADSFRSVGNEHPGRRRCKAKNPVSGLDFSSRSLTAAAMRDT